MSNVPGGPSPKLGNPTADSIRLKQGDPATPQDGEVGIILDSDGSLKSINSSGTKTALGGGSGTVASVTATTANGINNTDPANPIVLNAGASNAGLMSAANFSKLALLQVLPRYSATLGAPASEITVTGLAGNTDIAYRIDFSIIVAATSKCCPIPNGSESNLKAQVADFVAGAALATTWRLGKNGSLETTFTAGTVLTGRGYIYASTAHSGYRRFSLSVYADTGTDDVYYVEGVLTETATELTQFSVQPAAANGYDTGSWLTLTALG